jgi:hypothetical protein
MRLSISAPTAIPELAAARPTQNSTRNAKLGPFGTH